VAVIPVENQNISQGTADREMGKIITVIAIIIVIITTI
jgi:hypothetical protein